MSWFQALGSSFQLWITFVSWGKWKQPWEHPFVLVWKLYFRFRSPVRDFQDVATFKTSISFLLLWRLERNWWTKCDLQHFLHFESFSFMHDTVNIQKYRFSFFVVSFSCQKNMCVTNQKARISATCWLADADAMWWAVYLILCSHYSFHSVIDHSP